MATITQIACDHCEVDDSRSGVGRGNVNRVTCSVTTAKAELADLNHVADLCVDCEKELRDAVTRWMTLKEKSWMTLKEKK